MKHVFDLRIVVVVVAICGWLDRSYASLMTTGTGGTILPPPHITPTSHNHSPTDLPYTRKDQQQPPKTLLYNSAVV